MADEFGTDTFPLHYGDSQFSGVKHGDIVEPVANGADTEAQVTDDSRFADGWSGDHSD